MHTLGSILLALRKEKNISKLELCKRTKFNQGYVYRLENDLIKPSIDKLEIYCAAIGVSLWQVILYSDRVKNRDEDYKITLRDFDLYNLVADSDKIKDMDKEKNTDK